MQPDTAAPGMPRRAFLVTSALASAGAVLTPATGSPILVDDASGWPEPQLARLLPRTSDEGDALPSARCARVPSRSASLLAGSPCRLRVTPLSHPLSRIDGSFDLELYYPGPHAWACLWAVEPSPVRSHLGSPHAMSAPVESLAPSANGRVRLRITRRIGESTNTHTLDLAATPGSHLLAIPVTRGARTPAWRRCDVDTTVPHATTIADPWRAADAARGCVLLRLDLTPDTTNPTNTPAHGGD